MNRRLLLKALGTCIGAGWFFKPSKAKGIDSCVERVCDSTPLLKADWRKREYNGIVVRELATNFVLVKLLTGELRVARCFTGGGWKRGARLVLETDTGVGLWIRGCYVPEAKCIPARKR